jgi:hypothetical protein
MRFLVLGWLLMGFTLLFLVLVWLDASIAGRVVDYLFQLVFKYSFGGS